MRKSLQKRSIFDMAAAQIIVKKDGGTDWINYRIEFTIHNKFE